MFGFGVSSNLKPLEALAKKSPEMFNKSMKKGVIQFLTWANNGSAKESRKPPIRWGVMRGSSSGFVGNELVTVFKQRVRTGAEETPGPAISYSAPPTTMTWVWNTDYAAKMHEWKGGWGSFTEQDQDAGNKWAELHLKADREDLMKVIGIEYKKEAGL